MNISYPSREENINLLQQLIRIPTVNPPGKTEKIVRFIVDNVLKESAGFENKVITHSKNDILLHNLISQVGNGEFKIMFSGHFDVVPIGNRDNWEFDPFSGKKDGEYIYGRGSADMKSGLVCLLNTIKTLAKIPDFLRKCTLIFAGTADEEHGMTGAIKLRKLGLLDDIDLLIVAEPTNLNIGIAEKGVLWLEIEIKGKPAHGSTPQEGENAIEKALHLIPEIHHSLDPLNNPILGNSTVNIGKISGGTAINIVPDWAKLELDFRLIPEQEPGAIINNMDSINDIKEIKMIKTLPALKSNKRHRFISNLQKLTNTKFIGLPYATDAAELISNGRFIPFIIYGPGDPRVIHNYDEKVNINDVCYATETLIKALFKSY